MRECFSDMRRNTLLAVLPIAALLAAAGSEAATIQPDVLADDGAINGNCTLREAVEAANTNAAVDACPAGEALPVVDRIELAAGSYTLPLGQLELTEDVEIEGLGRIHTFLDADLDGRVLVVDVGVTAVVSGVGIHRGRASNIESGGCIRNLGTLTLLAAEVFDCASGSNGGGINNGGNDSHLVLDDVIVRRNRGFRGGGINLSPSAASLTLRNSVVKFNETFDPNGGNGGGILSFRSTVQIEDSRIHDNSANGDGGGIRINEGTLVLERVWIERNVSAGNGGGLHVNAGADLTVRASSITGNQAAFRGGGVLAAGNAQALIENSTLSGNQAGATGGGLQASGEAFVDLVHTTLADNTAGSGSAIGNGTPTRPDSEVRLENTLVDGDCVIQDGLPFVTGGGNLESPGSTCGLTGPGDQTGVADPVISVLGDHGGPTPTHLPLPGSPAIDSVPLGACDLLFDQRGTSRPRDGDGDELVNCDTGAVEVFFNEVDTVFADGFETGDTARWSTTVPAAP